MNDRNLERDKDRSVQCINDLVIEIESLEATNEELEAKIVILEDEIENLKIEIDNR